jgi:hypothetical protein
MAILDTITSLFGSKDEVKATSAKRGRDLRSAVRYPQRMRSGFLSHERLISPRKVLIKDLSATGARVEILGDPIKAALFADGVRLYFDSEKHEIPCSVAWCKGKSMGLHFEGRPRPPSRTYK